MLSILCFKNALIATDIPGARRAGVTYLGQQLSAQLRLKNANNDPLEAVLCVANALRSANGANMGVVGAEYGLWIDNGSAPPFVQIKTVSHNGNPNNKKIDCELDVTGTGGKNQKLTLTVHEDDEKNKDDRKMEIVIPGDRSRVNDSTPGSFYVRGVADEIALIRGGASDAERLDAGRYTLASITFRRCA